MKRPLRASLNFATVMVLACAIAPFAFSAAPDDDRSAAERILVQSCYDCHGDGADEGGFRLDELLAADSSTKTTKESWYRLLKQVRADLMPPPDAGKLSTDQKSTLQSWIVRSQLELDPDNVHPGRVTLRRLNRIEYRNSIKTLTGVDFDTNKNFPADDTGHGFDTIGDVLTISPLLLEKYFDAANNIMTVVVDREAAREKSTNDSDRQAAVSLPRLLGHQVPAGQRERDDRARKLLTDFASRAYRRPVDQATVDRLVALARSRLEDGQTFQRAVADAMTAVLASPRFIFREEFPISDEAGDQRFPLIDEFSLASRLSYFLWSSMPDETLFQLAGEGQLRNKLGQQLQRMIADSRFDQFAANFGGQWLQARSIMTVHINPRAVLGREVSWSDEDKQLRSEYLWLRKKDNQRSDAQQQRFIDLGYQISRKLKRLGSNWLDDRLRSSMRLETEKVLEYIFRDDRSLLELLDSDYTFLDERLAKHYGIPDVQGSEMYKVTLPESSVRGGVLTQATVLVTTSNPDRTSPVKRGVFILENLLGTPTASPPPDIPALDDAAVDGDQPLSLRESLKLHRSQPNCISCHQRMDPLGLALENFNAIGKFRDRELDQPIDVSGELVTGESFASIVELKQILRESRSTDFYRCLTEKLMTYALGRETSYRDVPAVDKIVADLRSGDGQSHDLLRGIIMSSAFQRVARSESE